MSLRVAASNEVNANHCKAEEKPMQEKNPPEFDQSCEQFAAFNQVKAQSVRARICRFGNYFGVVPRKLANGRLAFPRVQVAK